MNELEKCKDNKKMIITKIVNNRILYGNAIPKMSRKLLVDDINKMVFVRANHVDDHTLQCALEISFDDYTPTEIDDLFKRC